MNLNDIGLPILVFSFVFFCRSVGAEIVHWQPGTGLASMSYNRSCNLGQVLLEVQHDGSEGGDIKSLKFRHLTPVEEAFAYKRLMDNRKVTQTELAKIVGKRQNTVSEIVAITALPDTILNALEEYPHINKSQLIVRRQILLDS